MAAGIEVFSRLGGRGEISPIIQLARAHWASCIFKAAIKLDLFTELKGKALTSQGMASQMGLNHRHVEALLKACVALGLIDSSGDRYQNAKVSETYLVRGDEKYMGELVLFYANDMVGLAHLESAIRSGVPVEWEGKKISSEPMTEEEQAESWDKYMDANHAVAVTGQIDLLLNNTDLTGRKRLLDVAGGAGSYSIAACQKYPELTATLFDQEMSMPSARKRIEVAGLSDRISLIGGDWSTTPFGEGYDVVLFSAALCQVDMDMYRFLVKKAYDAMLPGGLLIIQDLLKLTSSPEKAGFYDIWDLWLIGCHSLGSGVYAGDEVCKLLTSVGFVSPQQISTPGFFDLITAVKP